MGIYTYIGNSDSRAKTNRILLRNGSLRIRPNEYANLSEEEINEILNNTCGCVISEGIFGLATSVGSIGAKLSKAPPILSSPVKIKVPTTFYEATFGEKEDVILEFPNAARTSSMNVKGGQNVQAFGGLQKLTSATTKGAAIRITGASQSIWAEGIFLDASGQTEPADAWNLGGVGSFVPDVYIQNCNITNVHGQVSSNHSDIYQAQGPIKSLYVDKFTADGNYQGIFIPPQFAIAKAEISRVNLKYNAITPHDATTYLLWFLSPGETSYPITLDQVYVAPREGQSVMKSSVWPNSENSEGFACFTGSDGLIRWPSAMKIGGGVISGEPPGGDFAPASSVGLGYVSPGYLG